MLVSAAAYADSFQRPTLWIREVTTDLCHERPYGAGLTFFNCQNSFGINLLSFGGSPNETFAETFLSSKAPTHKAAATRFALLAGKFMGRVDAAVLGQWRLRFVVILK